MAKEQLIKALNKALEMEHAARIQYLSHAELVDGLGAEPVVERLKEIAGDEKDHEEKFRRLVAILGGTPSMGLYTTHAAKGTKQILEVNLAGEKEAIDYYKTIMDLIKSSKDDLKYHYYTFEHEVRHVIKDEEEHVEEISLLLGIND